MFSGNVVVVLSTEVFLAVTVETLVISVGFVSRKQSGIKNLSYLAHLVTKARLSLTHSLTDSLRCPMLKKAKHSKHSQLSKHSKP